jgi:hypothetical protein
MISPYPSGTYTWHLNTWHTVDVTDEPAPSDMSRLYIDGVEVDSYYKGGWANVAGKLKIGSLRNANGSIIRLRNCWLIKGKILI